MKKQIRIFMFVIMLFSIKMSSQITISGPSSLTIGVAGNYSATNLAGYTYVWSISNSNVLLSSLGYSATLTPNAVGSTVLSVVAYKDRLSPSYCASYSITVSNSGGPIDPCATMYRIDDTSCSPGQFTANGWKFQLVNISTNLPVNPASTVWNSPSNPSTGLVYFIVDTANLGYMAGHPNPINFGGETPGDLQFSVICTVNGCSFFYKNYFGNTCGQGQTGYIKADGTWVTTGN